MVELALFNEQIPIGFVVDLVDSAAYQYGDNIII
jgi:hypothetical protein